MRCRLLGGHWRAPSSVLRTGKLQVLMLRRTNIVLVIASIAAVPALGTDSRGSLAILVPTREGLTVCADKREWNSVRGATDSSNKIRSVGSKLAFVVTGSVATLNTTTLEPEFSVYQEVERYLAGHPSQPFNQRISQLPIILEGAYAQYRKAGGVELMRSPGASDDVIFSVLVWYVSAIQVHVNRLEFHERQVSGSSHMSRLDMTQDLARSFYIEGETDFVLAAIRRSDPRFKPFKEDPDIQTVWTSTDASTIPVELAVRFSRKIIRATNEYHPLVSPYIPSLVSAAADCSLMSPSQGFKWINPK